jgi:hypothetical protein
MIKMIRFRRVVISVLMGCRIVYHRGAAEAT